MPDFSLTDNLGNPVEGVKVDWTSLSSLANLGKAAVFHLLVAPEFLAHKDQPLRQAAPSPENFQLKLGNDFALGDSGPDIDLSAGGQITLVANATEGSSLFDVDQFHAPADVPAGLGYVGLLLTGDVHPGVSAAAGNLTFGFDADTTVTIAYLKAFSTASDEPTLGAAAGQMISSFVIPAKLADVDRMGPGDVCSVSGQGSLTVSAGVSVSTSVNPLASVNLPLNAGTIAVQDGAVAGLTMSVTISGGYEIRVRRLVEGTIELSYLTNAVKTLTTDLNASAGVSVLAGKADLVSKVFAVIGAGKADAAALSGLTADEAADVQGEVKKSIDHSLMASLDLALGTSRETQVAFQYEIDPGRLDADATAAVSSALRGNLFVLTRLEAGAAADGTIAPGIRLKNSVLSKMQDHGVTLRINLLGLVNVLSLADLARQCEFIHEPATGELTIRETVRSERLNAITDPLKKQAALRQALFQSALVTTAYAMSGAVTWPALRCENSHFITRPDTKRGDVAEYLNWFRALNLLAPDRAADLERNWSGSGRSNCVLRMTLDDAGCAALFFDRNNALRPDTDYLEIGRQALKALLTRSQGDLDLLRYQFLDDNARWLRAVAVGPNDGLAELLPVNATDQRRALLLALVIGDVYDILWWSGSMRKAGIALQSVRTYVAGRDPAKLVSDGEFARRRRGLQDAMSEAIRNSKARFDEPWGLTCLHWAGGSRQAEGSIISDSLRLNESAGTALQKTAGAAE